jgi:hypothetical protein
LKYFYSHFVHIFPCHLLCYGRLVYLIVYLVYFYCFGVLYPEKSGSPDPITW